MGIKLPNDLSKLTDEALAELLANGTAEFDALLAQTSFSDAEVAEAERLHPLLGQLREEAGAREANVTARAERIEALRQASLPVQDEPAPEFAAAEPDPEPEAEILEPVTASVGATLIVPNDAPLVPLTAETQAAMPAAGSVAVARRTPRPVVPARAQGTVLVAAAADVPEFSSGQRIEDMTTVGKALINRMQGFPAFTGGSPAGSEQHFGVASFRKPFEDALVASGQFDGESVIQYAAKESRLAGGALTAAGGWCAPSETLYDFCTGESMDGILSIPEVQVSRGGLRYTTGIDFSTIYNAVGFCVTEAQAIAGTPDKTCYTVPCPSWTDVRLDACGVCIKVPILTESGYPELVARVLSAAMVAHQHKINSKVLATMASALGAAIPATDMGATTQTTLNAVELIAEQLAAQWRLPFTQSMEVVAPHWLKAAIRADLSGRAGVAQQAISDADIDAAFAARNVAVQWVRGWNDLPAGPLAIYPATTDILIYPSGTFVKGVSDVIRLNAVYDSASLVKNEYTGLFFEEGVLVAKTCYGGAKVTIPVCNSGLVGGPVTTPQCM